MADGDEKEEVILEEEEDEHEPLDECAGEDVFVNGDGDEENCDAPLREEEEEYEEEGQDGITDESGLPRRSSLMKRDASRRPKRKKTVSFSSMDKKIATGKGSSVNGHGLLVLPHCTHYMHCRCHNFRFS
jgi:hypothetical protein